METMDATEITIATICDSGVPEVFDRELREVLKNIADPNTAPERPRTLTLKFTFKPSEDRSQAVIDFTCRASLQPVKIVKSSLFLSRHSGNLKAYAVDTRQGALFPGEDAQPMSVVK